MPITREPMRGACRQAFAIALLTACLIFIPVMIWDKGYFFFFGDFNVQQIPFYKLAHEAVRSGDIFWNWYTDLGANFIGSYSFYLLGSPFFWLTLPFPTEFVPHLMGPLLILKHACAAFTGTLYLKGMVRTRAYAVLGGLLYNIFFNHFHEAIVFFPLLLVGLEELVVHNRRGLFALAVAVNAFVNYWFFIGEVVFVLLYFAVRSLSSEWRMTWGRFFWTAFESVVGLLLAMCLFLPSVLAILGNPRTGTTELLGGWNFWLYWHNQMYPAIVSSALFPPDLPSRPNLFPDRGAKWASLSAWLPMFSMCGVLAYLRSKRDWLRRMLLCCFIIALVPGLNAMFILFNNSYYARWYYMPLLLMSLATVRALESRSADLKWGFGWTLGITLGVTAALAFTPTFYDDGGITFGLTGYPARFAAVAATAILGLALFALLWRRGLHSPRLTRSLTVGCCFVIVAYSLTFIGMGKCHSDNTDFLRQVALDGRYQLRFPEEDGTFARADLYDCMDNLGMYWHLPNIQAFHSIVPVSLMEFYPQVGVKRDVSSKPETKYYQLRGLLSVRWLFVPQDTEDGDALMPGWSYRSTQMGYDLYENDYFIPMGFTYDGYIPLEDWEALSEANRGAALLRGIVLDEEGARAHGDILPRLDPEDYTALGRQDYYSDCLDRAASAGSSFEIDNRGFTSTIQLDRENLVFYSVPYDSGWSATVDGQPAPIQRASVGFMAVRVPAGEHVVRFTYTTPGLLPGLGLTAVGAVLLAAYLVLWRRYGHPLQDPPQTHWEPFDRWEALDEPAPEWEGTPPPSEEELPPPPDDWFQEPDPPQSPSKEE